MLASLPATLFGLLLSSSCSEWTPMVTLHQLVRGKTFILGSVTKGSTDVTGDFTGFKISFNAEGNKMTITSGGTNSVTCDVNAWIIGGTVDLAVKYPGNIELSTPNCLNTSILTGVISGGEDIEFNCTLPSSSIVITPGGRTSGTSDYTFKLLKQ